MLAAILRASSSVSTFAIPTFGIILSVTNICQRLPIGVPHNKSAWIFSTVHGGGKRRSVIGSWYDFSGSPQMHGTQDEPGISQFRRLCANRAATIRRPKISRLEFHQSRLFIVKLVCLYQADEA